MKSYILIVLVCISHTLFSQTITFSDPVFKAKLIENNVDSDNDGEIQITEAEAVFALELGVTSQDPEKISAMDELFYFINLESLEAFNNELTTIDISALTQLSDLNLRNNNLTTITLGTAINLTNLNLRNSALTTIDLSDAPNLNSLLLGGNPLGTIDISDLTNVTFVDCRNCGLEEINTQNNTSLIELSLANNNISSIDISTNINLTNLSIENNDLDSIFIPENTSLSFLNINQNNITAIDLENRESLSFLYVGGNNISEIDASSSGLIYLHCEDNPNLTFINTNNGIISQADPDLLDFPFVFIDLPSLEEVVIDCGEEEALSFSGYNSDTVDVECLLSNEDFALNEIYAFPNPFTSTFTISETDNIVTYALYTLQGKQVLKNKSLENLRTKTLQLHSGTYLLVLTSLDNRQKVIRLIKQ